MKINARSGGETISNQCKNETRLTVTSTNAQSSSEVVSDQRERKQLAVTNIDEK